MNLLIQMHERMNFFMEELLKDLGCLPGAYRYNSTRIIER